MKNVLGTLTEIALTLSIALGSRVVLITLTLQIQEYGMSFHLFVSSLVSFISVLYFSEYRSFVSLGRFIPKSLIILDASDGKQGCFPSFSF